MPGDHPPDRGIFIVELQVRREHDEELAVGAVGLLRPRHRHHAAHMRQIVEFGLEVGQVRTAGAIPLGVAPLRHEPLDHPVKDQPVVEAASDERLDPLDRQRRLVGPQQDGDAASGADRSRLSTLAGSAAGAGTGGGACASTGAATSANSKASSRPIRIHTLPSASGAMAAAGEPVMFRAGRSARLWQPPPPRRQAARTDRSARRRSRSP